MFCYTIVCIVDCKRSKFFAILHWEVFFLNWQCSSHNPSLLAKTESLGDANFIPNHYNLTCHQLICQFCKYPIIFDLINLHPLTPKFAYIANYNLVDQWKHWQTDVMLYVYIIVENVPTLLEIKKHLIRELVSKTVRKMSSVLVYKKRSHFYSTLLF